MSEFAIKVENLAKTYRLGQVGAGSLKEDLGNWWRRRRGGDDPAINRDKLREKYGDRVEGNHFHALRDVSFEVKQGEVLGIIGANGAGKSTLLKILSRITEPTSGRAIMRGRLSSLLEVGTGFHPDLTGRENIYLNGAIMGLTRADVNQRFDRIVEFAGVEAFVDTPVKRYSSGMNVRLGFAVAAHLEPDILIVDEVLAVGDAGFQRKCISRLKELSVGGRTILFVSHNLYTLQTLCERGILLESGRLLNDGPMIEVLGIYRAHMQNDISEGTGKNITSSSSVNLRGWKINESLDRVQEYNDAIKLTVSWEFDVLVAEDLSFGISLRTAEGMWIFGFSTFLENHAQKFEEGTHEAKLEIPRLDIPSGTYLIQLTILDEHGVASHANIGTAAVFHVIRRDRFVGLIGLEHYWEFDTHMAPSDERKSSPCKNS